MPTICLPHDPVTSEEIQELVLRVALSDLHDEAAMPLVRALVSAWSAAVDLEAREKGEDPPEYTWVCGSEAERDYRVIYGTPEVETREISYPDALPYESPVPYWLISKAALFERRDDDRHNAEFFQRILESHAKEGAS